MRTARTSSERQKHGCVIVKGGRLLSVGRNSMLLDPYYYSTVATKFSVHAEEAALARLEDASGAVLYVARINNSGEPMMSKPCPECQLLIDAAGVKRVVYTR